MQGGCSLSSCGIFKQLDTIVIRVRDVDKSSKWYAAKLELTEKYVSDVDKLVIYDLGNTNLTLWQLKPGEEFSPQGMRGTYPVFSVYNADETRDLLIARDVRVTNVYETGGIRVFYFYDPDGNCMEACQSLHL